MTMQTLAEVEAELTAARAALAKARHAISYGIGDRTLARARLPDLIQDVARLERSVRALTNVQQGVNNADFLTPKWN